MVETRMTVVHKQAPALAITLAAALAGSAPALARVQAGAPAPAPAAAPAADDKAAAEDRIMTLVRQGKCGPARTEAVRIGDTSLADQIGAMCGAKSSDPFAKSKGGGGGGGGRRGGRGG